MFKRAKVILIPTEKSGMYIDGLMGNLIVGVESPANKHELSKTVHFYIVSDDEIKEGDWVKLHVKHIGKEWIHRVSKQDLIEYPSFNNEGKKIIATTDDLKITPRDWKPGEAKDIRTKLPQPSQAFVEKYVEQYNKGDQIIDVLVEYGEIETCPNGIWKDAGTMELALIDDKNLKYPHREKLKVNPKDNTVTIKKVKDSWSREEETNP